VSLRWSEKDLAAFNERRGRRVVSSDRGEGRPIPDRSQPSARSGGDSGQPIVIILPGEPQGKGRTRFRIAKRSDGSSFVAGYTPKATVLYERALAHAGFAKEFIGGPPLLF